MPMLIFFCKSLPAHSSTTTACWENGYIDLDKAKCYFSSDWCLHLFLHLPVFLGKDIQAISKPFINAFLTKPTKGIYIYIYIICNYTYLRTFCEHDRSASSHPPKITSPKPLANRPRSTITTNSGNVGNPFMEDHQRVLFVVGDLR